MVEHAREAVVGKRSGRLRRIAPRIVIIGGRARRVLEDAANGADLVDTVIKRGVACRADAIFALAVIAAHRDIGRIALLAGADFPRSLTLIHKIILCIDYFSIYNVFIQNAFVTLEF